MNEKYINTKWDMSDYSSSQREEWIKIMTEEHGASLSMSSRNNNLHLLLPFFIVNNKGVIISTPNPNSDIYFYYVWADPTEILPLDDKPSYEELKELSLEVIKNVSLHGATPEKYMKKVVDAAECLYDELKSRTK